MACALFLCWLRSSWHSTTVPVGRWVMRMAESVLFTCWPPAPEARREQVGTGDRSERIRTYNFPQGRVTDHRINLTLYKIDRIMDGELDDLVDALAAEQQAEQLAQLAEEAA